MDRGDLATRRRSVVETPPKPEAGLAEWTSRIKALQKQVDDDEEAETKRLEQEIAASRLARMRRSTGRGTSVDLSNTDVARSLKEDESKSTAAETPTPTVGRRDDRENSLRKLMGERGVFVPPPTASSPATPMSLAAFIGGRATGPRLNRHAPQQDAHDPTQFEQPNITAPHPIFGRGGVAMPGMTGRNHRRDEGGRSPKPVAERAPSNGRTETPVSSGPSLKVPTDRKEERRSVSPQKTGGSSHSDFNAIRQRTMSTPAQPSALPISTSRSPEPHTSIPKSSPRPPSYAQGDYMAPKTISQPGRHTPSNRAPQTSPPRANSVSPLPQTSMRQPPSPSLPQPKSPVTSTSPGLAKPIQPSPRKSYQGPQMQLSQNASPAFLRAPPLKDPTPSISRLQGRGFVQNMVKASSQISSSSPGTPEKERDTPRKGSVLERWQFNSASPSPPIIAPKPVPLRKSRTMDASLTSPTIGTSPAPTSPSSPAFRPSSAKPLKHDHTGRSLKSKSSLPSLRQSPPADKAPPPRPASTRIEVDSSSPHVAQKRGLGSSTTMISYIKPLKTGDNPSTGAPPSRPSSRASRSRPATPEVDEMGNRVRSRAKSVSGAEKEGGQDRHVGSPSGATDGRPLSHPTKDRARKPRKAKTTPNATPAGALQHGHSGTSAPATHPTPGSRSENTLAPPPAARTSRVRFSPEPEEIPDPPSYPREKRTPSPSPPSSGVSRRVHFPLVDIPTTSAPVPAPQEHHEPSPSTPIRHTRIPSTGNRATVMEVAQALSEHEKHAQRLSSDISTAPLPVASPKREEPPIEESTPPRLDVKAMVSNWGQSTATGPPSPTMEKRKSSYEKYSAFALPPLVEERTPAVSPAGTLSRNGAPALLKVPEGVVQEVVESPMEIEPPAPPPEQPAPPPEDRFQHFEHHDEPLPTVDVAAMLNAKPLAFKPDPDVTSISVEVMCVVGSNATVIATDYNVFYDSEVLAIVHRFKAKSNGLVNTKVWAWHGSKSEAGEREEKKLQELARRYNTSLTVARQYSEPAELVHVIGGQLATRQGTRTHWSAENTTMHLVRAIHGIVHVDELELSIKNLCSGYSYCLSLLETFYVWHGCGSTPDERQAALRYAQSLVSDHSNVIELAEGSSDGDEMFWLILGEGEYAKADYWRWKPSAGPALPRAWQVDANKPSDHVTISSIGADIHDHVYILDCVWEYFVVVGSDARQKRKDIRLALDLARRLSTATAPARPFCPTVHALILPSQLPADLRITFRELDESAVNRGLVPDHMNLLSYSDAIEHLQKTSWEKSLLRDETMLPLGLHAPR